MKKDPFLEYSQSYFFEDFLDHPSFHYKRMFGGLALYFNGLLVAVLMEEGPDSSWNGFLIPTDRVHHQSLKNEIPELINHPVLGKWLYAAMTSERYEENCEAVVRLIRRGDPRVGIIPGLKKNKKMNKSTSATPPRKAKSRP